MQLRERVYRLLILGFMIGLSFSLIDFSFSRMLKSLTYGDMLIYHMFFIPVIISAITFTVIGLIIQFLKPGLFKSNKKFS